MASKGRCVLVRLCLMIIRYLLLLIDAVIILTAQSQKIMFTQNVVERFHLVV